MIIALMIALVVFIVGCVATSITILNLLDKCLDVLISHLKHSPSRASNSIEYVRGHSNYETSHSQVSIQPHISPQKIIHTAITRFSNNIFKITLTKTGGPCQNSDTQGSNKNSFGYLKGCVPIKHIGNIVDRLRRRVNQSGKEPFRSDFRFQGEPYPQFCIKHHPIFNP